MVPQKSMRIKRKDVEKLAKRQMEVVEDIEPILSFHFACPGCKTCINVEISQVKVSKVKK